MQHLLLLSLLTTSVTAKYSIRSDIPEDEPPLPGESPVKYQPTPTPQWDLPCNHPGCPYIDHHPDRCSRVEDRWKCVAPYYDNAAVPIEFMKDGAVTTPVPALEDSDGQSQAGPNWWTQTHWTTTIPKPESDGMRAPGVTATAAPTPMLAAPPVETSGSGSGSGSEDKSGSEGENELERRQDRPTPSRPSPGMLPAFCHFFQSARGCKKQETRWLDQSTLHPQATASADQDVEVERRGEERAGPVPPCKLHPKGCHPPNGKDLSEQEVDVPEPNVQSEYVSLTYPRGYRNWTLIACFCRHSHFYPTPTIPTGFITSFTQQHQPAGAPADEE